MTLAAETAVAKIPADATWDPDFLTIFVSKGLSAALVHLAEKNDLNEIEVKAVQATIMGLISAEQA